MAEKKSQRVSIGSKERIVLREFGKRKLRTPQGKIVTDPKQAFAIAKSEARAAKKRGSERRTFKGRTRVRPKLTRTLKNLSQRES